MSHFHQKGKHFFVTYITGPSHVCLGLALSTSPVEASQLVAKPSIGDCSHGTIDELQLEQAVIDGVAAANQKIGTSFHPIEIVYVLNDSPRYELYSHCAQLIVEHFQSDLRSG